MKEWELWIKKKTEYRRSAKRVSHIKTSRKGQAFYLDEKNQSIYFTKREMETLFYLTNGHTMASSAEALGLSARTVEFYLNNMKLKANVRTKSELIRMVLASPLATVLDRFREEGSLPLPIVQLELTRAEKSEAR